MRCLISSILNEHVPLWHHLAFSTPSVACNIGTMLHSDADAAGMTSTEAGVLDALQHGVPRCLVVLSKRALRQELAGNALLLGVLDVAARCLCQLCSHADGKAAVRNAEGVEGEELFQTDGWLCWLAHQVVGLACAIAWCYLSSNRSIN